MNTSRVVLSEVMFCVLVLVKKCKSGYDSDSLTETHLAQNAICQNDSKADSDYDDLRQI